MVSWDGGTNESWEVWTQRDDDEPQLFGAGARGSREATWITIGHTYRFTLSRQGKPADVVAQGETVMALRAPSARTSPVVHLTPNPFPNDVGPLGLRLDWDTGDGSDGKVVFVRYGPDGSTETVAGVGPIGTRLIDWKIAGQRVEFRLYRDSDRGGRPAARVVGRRIGERRAVLLDIMALGVSLCLWPLALTLRLWQRLTGPHHA